MSLFQKRGSAVPEMLFGSGKAGTPSTPGHKNGAHAARRASANSETAAPAESHHNVFYVRGRPFIAPATGASKLMPRQELFEPHASHAASVAEVHEHELSLKRASIIASGEQAHARRASFILTTHSSDAGLRADSLIDSVANGDFAHAHPQMQRRESAPKRPSTACAATPSARRDFSSRTDKIAAAMSAREENGGSVLATPANGVRRVRQ